MPSPGYWWVCRESGCPFTALGMYELEMAKIQESVGANWCRYWSAYVAGLRQGIAHKQGAQWREIHTGFDVAILRRLGVQLSLQRHIEDQRAVEGHGADEDDGDEDTRSDDQQEPPSTPEPPQGQLHGGKENDPPDRGRRANVATRRFVEVPHPALALSPYCYSTTRRIRTLRVFLRCSTSAHKTLQPGERDWLC